MTVNFDWRWMVAAAVALAALVAGLVVLAARRKRARLARLAEPALIARLAPPNAIGPARWRSVRLGAAALLAGIGLAGPRWGQEPAVVRGEGIDVVLALDASLSMMATDERPNRLERMKQEVRRYRALAGADRIAMLAFAGRSYILTPLTVDEGALELFLENLDPSIVGQAGSSLARTITQGTDLVLSTKSTSDRALVVMSDGEAFEPIEDVRAAAQRAAQNGISIVAVGFGTTEGSTIPMREGESVVPKRDENNEIVITKYHPEVLSAIAEASGGTFIDAAATDKATRIRAALQTLRTSSRAVAGGMTQTARFQWFIAPALLLLLLDTWLTDRRKRRVRRSVVAVAGAVAMAGCALPGAVPRDAAREYAAGRYPRAAALYRFALSKGDSRPQIVYNLGTALLAADSLEAAIEPLERASRPEDAELRFRALFNLGLSHLIRGLAGEPAADSTKELLKNAIDTYKRALILRSTDRDAKWNYELALRKDDESSGGGGGGGGGGSDSKNESEPDTPQSAEKSGGLGEQQAEQLLNAAAREERGVQGRKQRQNRPQPPPGGKDW